MTASLVGLSSSLCFFSSNVKNDDEPLDLLSFVTPKKKNKETTMSK
jgi:hypothetical protein